MINFIRWGIYLKKKIQQKSNFKPINLNIKCYKLQYLRSNLIINNIILYLNIMKSLKIKF